MIGRLTGHVVERTPGVVVIDVGGVGYEVQIPLSTFYRIDEAVGERTTLWIHTLSREDALALYGFSTREERVAFQDLIAISGVGPRMALAVLSGLEVADLRGIVEAGDRSLLERIPGIGRKTAERILLELRDRSTDRKRRRVRGAPQQAPSEPRVPAGPRADAISALTNLGYPMDAAIRAVDAALVAHGEDCGIEQVLKAALRSLVR